MCVLLAYLSLTHCRSLSLSLSLSLSDSGLTSLPTTISPSPARLELERQLKLKLDLEVGVCVSALYALFLCIHVGGWRLTLTRTRRHWRLQARSYSDITEDEPESKATSPQPGGLRMRETTRSRGLSPAKSAITPASSYPGSPAPSTGSPQMHDQTHSGSAVAHNTSVQEWNTTIDTCLGQRPGPVGHYHVKSLCWWI